MLSPENGECGSKSHLCGDPLDRQASLFPTTAALARYTRAREQLDGVAPYLFSKPWAQRRGSRVLSAGRSCSRRHGPAAINDRRQTLHLVPGLGDITPDAARVIARSVSGIRRCQVGSQYLIQCLALQSTRRFTFAGMSISMAR